MNWLISFNKKNIIEKTYDKEKFYQHVISSGFENIDTQVYDSWGILKVHGTEQSIKLFKNAIKDFYTSDSLTFHFIG
jgi:hypothetical protein